MTALTRPVRRSTEATVGASRPITIELVPPFTIRFREKGRRTVYSLTVQQAFKMAALFVAEQRLAERRARKVSRG